MGGIYLKIARKILTIWLIVSIQFLCTHICFMEEPQEYSNDVVVKVAPVHHATIHNHVKNHLECQTISYASPVEIGRTAREVVHHFFSGRTQQREHELFKQRPRSTISINTDRSIGTETRYNKT